LGRQWAIRGLTLLYERSVLEKRELASNINSSLHISAMVCALADFPAPAETFTHLTKEFSSLSHLKYFMISERTARKVLG